MKTNSLVFALLFLKSSIVYSYIGPGSGLSAIGSLLALIGTLLLLLVGFCWYPLKRLFKYRNNKKRKIESEEETQEDKQQFDDTG